MCLIFVLLMASGCGGTSQEQIDGKTSSSETSEPVNLTFATMGVGTGMYVYASSITQLIEPVLPEGSTIDVVTTSPGGVGAPIVIEEGKADLCLGNSAPAKWACTEGILGKPPVTNVASIVGGLDAPFINVMFTQSFVNKTGYTTLEEVVENKYPIRIAIKSTGSFGELACSSVLQALGIDYKTIESWGGSVTQTGSDAIVTLLRDGKADMTIDHLAAGQSATTELCMTTDMFFPQLSDELINKLVESGWDRTIMPAGTWKGQDKDIKTVGSGQVLLCSKNLPNDIVYAMTKAICEGKEILASAHNAMSVFDPTIAWQESKCGAPLHPGAEQYYKEMGYMK
ncbi:MAG: TAXI family TRAP transporter solute-binding subunit [Tepidanaerobacter acetatoxydans]|nr:TAXI family TRAP transporter solute-binding subunit [Tepidanaerobacter acetatoxydans]